MASNWRDCVAFALNRPLRAGEDAALKSRFENAQRRRAFAGEAADDASVASAIGAEIRAEEAIAKRNILLNQVAYRALRAYDGKFGNKALAVRAALGGINELIEGGRLSIDAQHGAIRTQYLGGLLADLRKAGASADADLVKFAMARDNELAIRKALRGEDAGDPLAAKVGEILNKWFETARLRENRAGSWIGHLDDYGGGQSHDSRLVWKAGFDEWFRFTAPMLDIHRTMKEAADLINPEPFLRDVWNGISANLHERSNGAEFNGLHKYLGPANLGSGRSAPRILHFKDAAAAQTYNDRFGNGSLMEAVLGRFDKSARATALMETLGPNPEAMLDRWRKDLARAASDRGDAKGAQALNAKHIDNLFAEVTGRTRAAAAGGAELAHWSGALRAIESMSKLGAATLSSIGDIATVAAELRYQGRGFLSSYAEAFSGLMRGRGAGETRMIADLLGVGFDGILGGVHARFHSTDGTPGQMSRLLNLFFRFNGLNLWTDAHKTTAGLVTARYMALEAASPWTGLRTETQRLLSQYGIDRDGWNVLRRSGLARAEDGTQFLTPAGIRDMDVTDFAKVAGKRYADLGLGTRALEDARDRLATAYQALIVDRADFAVPTPGARERAWMNQGTERGTVLGETLRFAMQFKAFPIAMIGKVAGREVAAAGGYNMSALRRMGELIVQLTAMGYLSMSAKDLARGKEPPDPLNINTFWRSMTQGGGAGIYGDFIFGEHDRFGRAAAETALGPAFGTAGDIVKLLNKAVRGEADAAEGLRFAVQNTPFLNLFYARPALDYFVLHPVYESLKPGYTARLQREAAKRFGQDYYWY